MAGWTVPPTDLILGDPNGAHIELIASEAKITLYNEFGVPIMVFDGTSTFLGDTFSQINIRNKEGADKLQLDQFQAALVGIMGARIRMVPGENPAQLPRLEIEPIPITEGRLTAGEVRGESDDATNGGSLVLQSPTFGAFTPASITLLSQHTTNPRPRVTTDADVILSGELSLTLPAYDTLTPESFATLSGFVNTAPTPSAPVFGTAFTAPPSGRVFLSIGGNISSSAAAYWCALGAEVRTGDVIGAGTVVRTAILGRALVSPRGGQIGGTRRREVAGLTPGALYNAQAVHWVENAAGSGSFTNRDISVEPII